MHVHCKPGPVGLTRELHVCRASENGQQLMWQRRARQRMTWQPRCCQGSSATSTPPYRSRTRPSAPACRSLNADELPWQRTEEQEIDTRNWPNVFPRGSSGLYRPTAGETLYHGCKAQHKSHCSLCASRSMSTGPSVPVSGSMNAV